MCRKEKFSECLGNPRRHFLELITISRRKKYTRGPRAYPRDSPPCRVRPLSCGPPGPQPTSTPTPYIHIRGEKNKREGFIAFYDTEPPPSPKPSRGADLESVRGSGEGDSHRHHHQPSSITNFMMLTAVR